MELTSPAFRDGGLLPLRFTCDGAGVSPPLHWDDVTPGTQAFTIICEDPDAPDGTFTHWLLYKVPWGTRSIEQGLPADEVLSLPAYQGRNDFGTVGYGAACPPRLRKHRYIFTLYALDKNVIVPPGVRRQQLNAAIQGHVLDEAQIRAVYQR